MSINENNAKKITFLFLSIINVILVLSVPLVTMRLIDLGILVGSWTNVLFYFFLLLSLSIAIDLSNTYIYYLENYIQLKDGITLRENLHLKIRKIKNINNIQDNLSIYTTDIDVMREKDTTKINLITSISKMILVIIVISWIDIKIVLLATLMMVTLPIIPLLLSKKLLKVSDLILESKSNFVNYASKSLNSSKEIRVDKLEKLDFKNLAKYLALTKPPILYFHKLNSLAVLNNLVYTILFCVAILISINEIFKGNSTIGSLTALMSYLALASTPIQEITGHYNHLRVIEGSPERYNNVWKKEEVLFEEINPYNSFSKTLPLIDIKNIKKENLDITINLSIFDSEWILVKGDSGTGKTTFLNILSMVDHDYEGEVIFKGKKLSKLTTNELYKSLTYVMQNHQILDDTQSSQMLLSIENLNAFKYHLKKLKISYLFDKNVLFQQMSGGEKQRFLLALALEKSPEILILDEPTSALDTENSINLINHLKEERIDKTTIIVSHDEKFDFIEKKLVLQ